MTFLDRSIILLSVALQISIWVPIVLIGAVAMI